MRNISFYLSILICCFAASLNAKGQGHISGKITDSHSQPIPFVSIGFVGTTIGTVSDQFGNYSLAWDEALDATSILKYSCMGFLAQERAIKDLMKTTEKLNIVLQDAAIELNEVLIRPIAIKKIVEGNDNESTAIRTNLAISSKPNMNLGAEIGRKFRLKNKPHFVNSLRVFMNNNYDTVTVRINFYELSGSKPTQPVQQKSIIRQMVNHKSGWVTFDLADEYLVLSGTTIASIEWIGASKKGNYLAFNLTMPAIGQTHYYKYGAQNDWKVFRNMSTSMILEADMGYN